MKIAIYVDIFMKALSYRYSSPYSAAQAPPGHLHRTVAQTPPGKLHRTVHQRRVITLVLYQAPPGYLRRAGAQALYGHLRRAEHMRRMGPCW